MSVAPSVLPAGSFPTKPVYDLQETAQLLRVSVPTVRRFISRGELRPTRLRKRVLVMHEDIVDFLRRMRGN